MPIDFPNSPSLNDLFTSGSTTWKWDGAKWNFSSDWMQADEQILKPLVKSTAAKYAADKKLAPRTPQDCQS